MTTEIRKVNCFGGSSTYGYGNRDHYTGWAGRLKQDFHEANDNGDVEYKDLAAILYLSILGNTALKLCDQVTRERVIRARRRLSDSNYRVAITYLPGEELVQAPGEMQVPLDVRDVTKIKETFKQIENELGPIDVLVNSAGINVQQ